MNISRVKCLVGFGTLRRLLTATLSVSILILGMIVAATPASAAGTCNAAAVTGRFSPGLRLVETQNNSLDFTVVAGICTMSDPTITSMRMLGQGSGQISCTAGGMTGTGRIDWGTSDGEEEVNSTVDWTMTHVLPEWVFTGTVKSGEFQGETWQMMMVGGSHPAECESQDGLENFAATATVTFA